MGFTAAPIFAATAVKVEETKEAEKSVTKYRPRDLPLYTPLYPEEKYNFVVDCVVPLLNCPTYRKCHPGVSTAKKSALEEGISAVRGATQDAYDAVLSQTKQIDDFIATGKEHTRCKQSTS